MGLGKTVEILSLLLCHPRSNVPRPEWQEPMTIVEKEKRKRRKRARSPSPVEFRIEEKSRQEPSEDILMQLDGNQVFKIINFYGNNLLGQPEIKLNFFPRTAIKQWLNISIKIGKSGISQKPWPLIIISVERERNGGWRRLWQRRRLFLYTVNFERSVNFKRTAKEKRQL